jgi:hypothetical protein
MEVYGTRYNVLENSSLPFFVTVCQKHCVDDLGQIAEYAEECLLYIENEPFD